MENFIKQHDKSKQISLTGARALVLLLMLIESPKTFEQIKKSLVKSGVANREYSIDTIRIDINTLKRIGCKISKATKISDRRYSLISHPYMLDMDVNEINALKSVYDKIVKQASPQKLLGYHYLFNQLSDMVEDESIKEKLRGISLLKSVNTELVYSLVANEKRHNKIKIQYLPPYSSEERIFDITVEQLKLRNDKLYVYCYNHSVGKRSFLNVTRIKSILCNMFDKDSPVGLDTCIKFKLSNYNEYELDDNETIIEEKDGYQIISGRYFNEFIGIQRILSFASDAVVIEPAEIKDEIIKKLKEMRAIYG